MDYQDFDSEEETPAPLKSETNAVIRELSSEPESDIDNNDNANQSDSDDSDRENPLVLADADISDDESTTIAGDKDNIVVSSAKLKPISTTVASKDLKPNTTAIEEKVLDSVKGKSTVQQDQSSSEDEDVVNIKYEVTGDFDLDEPSIDDWLGGGKKETKRQASDDTKEVEISTFWWQFLEIFTKFCFLRSYV